MRRNASRRQVLGGLATIGAAGLAGCTGQETKTETTIRTVRPAGERLTVSNPVGEITVRGESRENVEIAATKQAPDGEFDRLAVTVETGEQVAVTGEITEDRLLRTDNEVSIDLTIAVPRELPVTRIEGAVGDVVVRETTGDLTVQSTVGSIDVAGVSGAVAVETTVGDAVVRDIDSLVAATATTGDLTLDVPAIDGATTVETTVGDVALALASGIDATLDAETSTGDVTVTDLPVELRADTVTGTLGDGGPSLSVETTTGDIRLRRL